MATMAPARSEPLGTTTSTTALAQSLAALPTMRMSPLGTNHTVPSLARMVVTRRLTSSTVPVTAPTVMRSPTPYWSSARMKKPDTKSFTRLWAPKARARPTMPAPASRGPRLRPTSPAMSRMATVQMATRRVLAATLPRVVARCSARADFSASGPARPSRVTDREARRLPIRLATMAAMRMKATRNGPSIRDSTVLAAEPSRPSLCRALHTRSRVSQSIRRQASHGPDERSVKCSTKERG